MAITIGTQLGSHEITALLGQGGMGEVYRARDTKLGREVAIKVLPDAFARDAERIARFEREARLLASLNHPHIAMIYGLEEYEGHKLLVMELATGESLADRIERGPLPLDDALAIAKQVAEALEAAHEKDIVHRDLKPANIMVAPDGRVKVLDFGLAKAFAAPKVLDISNSPTMLSGSLPGIIVGTAAYMSPEQAKGKETDHRTDVWAFGCLLYEMLAGKPAFQGETFGEVLGAIFKTNPDGDLLPKNTPSAVRRLLKRCLEKDPHRRLRDIGDAIIEIDEAAAFPADLGPEHLPKTTRARTPVLLAAAVAMIVGAVAASAWFRFGHETTVETRALQIATGDGIDAPQISPDGHAVVFVLNDKLVVRALDDLDSRELQGTDGASNPFWSPDSKSIGYFAGGQLRAVSEKGGASRIIASNAFAPWGGSWCPRGLVFARFNQGLWLGSDSGQPQRIAEVDTTDGRANLLYPYCLSDGRILAVARRDSIPGAKNTDVQSLMVIDGDRRSTLFELRGEAIVSPIFVEPDSVLFERRGNNSGIWKITVSRNLATVAGSPVRLLPDGAHPSFSSTGILVSLAGARQSDRELLVVNRSGQKISTFGKPQAAFTFRDPSISPDGSRIAVGIGGTARDVITGDIWIHYEAAIQRFTTDNTDDDPAWSPSGNLIAYAAQNSDGTQGLFVRPVSGSGDTRLLAKAPYIGNPAWSGDGKSIVYESGSSFINGRPVRDFRDLWLVTLDGQPPKLLLKNATEPAVSPDTRLLAYTSPISGRDEIYVTTFPKPGNILPVSSDAGRYPRWNPRGGELFFASGAIIGSDPNSRRDLSVVKIGMQNGIKVGQPERLFDTQTLNFRTSYASNRSYDVFPDGQRFVMQTVGVEGTPSITLVENLREWMTREH